MICLTSRTQIIAIDVQPHLLFSDSHIVPRDLPKIDQNIDQKLLLELRYMYAVSSVWKGASHILPLCGYQVLRISMLPPFKHPLNIQPGHRVRHTSEDIASRYVTAKVESVQY
jgi:hypothetical protein